jgi:ssDNA-binding Zn-finger/Zn-ribbon topoisomerase 1
MIKVVHSELTHVDGSDYRVVCPECGHGVMGLRRDFRSGILLSHDDCPSCRKKFIFEDINILRRKEWAERKKLKIRS